jgi:hypothetical protein
MMLGSATKNFYSDASSGPTFVPPSSARREGDPFYLNSAPPSSELLGAAFIIIDHSSILT